MSVEDFVAVASDPTISVSDKTYRMLDLASRASVLRDIEAALRVQSLEAEHGNP